MLGATRAEGRPTGGGSVFLKVSQFIAQSWSLAQRSGEPQNTGVERGVERADQFEFRNAPLIRAMPLSLGTSGDEDLGGRAEASGVEHVRDRQSGSGR